MEYETVDYFAIGSMVNPYSLASRGLRPLESRPGEILDYKLEFLGPMGMAGAVKCEGMSFHGVLHRMSLADMEALDKIESSYARVIGNIRLYDGTIVEGTVYVFKESYPENNLPSERYIEIITKGCMHFGVAQSYIDYLNTITVIPRRKPEEFMKIPVEESLPIWTLEDVAIGNGEDGNPMYVAINDKVREYIGATDSSAPPFFPVFQTAKFFGKDLDLLMPRMLYDPKYGVYDTHEEMSREHCASLEDFHVTNVGNNFKTIALIVRCYRD